MSSEKKILSLEEVKSHNTRDSTWCVIHNNVYDITQFLDEVSYNLSVSL